MTISPRTFFHSRPLSLLLLAFLVTPYVHAQDRDKKDPKTQDMFDFTLPDRTSSLAQPAGVALESPVDPDAYYVGPSDVIAVNFWMSPPQSYSLTVTPEGTLIIPTVGEVMVTGMTLASAKGAILDEVRKFYRHVSVSATLVKPRPIIVNVVGNVMNPGLYVLTGADRANKAIDDANKMTRGQEQEDLDQAREGMSTRHILVRHRDGSEERADLPKYFATHDGTLNPYLREGDVVVVPQKDKRKSMIAVYGQVRTNGKFEFVEGDKLLDALNIANGLTSRALADQAIFSRLSEDGNSITNTTINIADVLAGKGENVLLRPGDRLVVPARPEMREDFNVDVRGEVKYPGTYPITRNRTHLSEIIAQAGGFTEFASMGSAEVIRQTFEKSDHEREQLLSSRGSIASQDTTGFSLETGLRLTHETVSADFEKLFVHNDSTRDVILQAEDQIIVPSRRQTIYVFGQVRSPGHIPFVIGRDPRYYIEKSDGFTDHADGGSMKVVKGKTKQWLSPGETKLEEGDYIWVPASVDHPFWYYMTAASQVASVLSVVIGVAVLIVQVSK